MNILPKSLYLFLLLLTACQCNKTEEKVFRMIFGTNTGSVLLVQSDKPTQTTELMKFQKFIADLALYENYLFVVVEPPNMKENALLRFRVNDTTNFTLDKDYEVFDSVEIQQSGTYMTTAGKYLFLAGKDNVVLRCEADLPNSCDNFTQLHTSISGLSYYGYNNKLYVSLVSGSLLHCSPNYLDSCKEVYKTSGDIANLKVALGAIWINTQPSITQKYELHKCSFEHPNGCSGETEIFCEYFHDFRSGNSTDVSVFSIAAARGLLFVNVYPQYIWRCSPKLNTTCAEYLPRPPYSNVFTIV